MTIRTIHKAELLVTNQVLAQLQRDTGTGNTHSCIPDTNMVPNAASGLEIRRLSAF